MQRRVFIMGFASAALGASMAGASGYESGIIEQLREQGFGEIKVEKTWLGRLRITASKAGAGREIVLNPRTGEILRDIVFYVDGSVSPRIGESQSSQPGSSGNGSGSGSGNGNSGSGHDDDSHDDGNHGGSDHGGSDDGGDDGENDDER